jgi:beta-mannosidase
MSTLAGWTMLVAAAGEQDPRRLHWDRAQLAPMPLSIGRERDEDDVWLRCALRGPATLSFPMLGPIADLYVDGVLKKSTRSLFRTHSIELEAGEHELAIALRSPARDLASKRPRPRWKTRLTEHQQLRWLRTPLLGRMPSWSPEGAARGVLRVPQIGGLEASVHAWLDGEVGHVTVTLPPGSGEVELRVGLHVARGTSLRIERPPLWWPHTHGTPARLPVTLTCDGRAQGLGHVGFRAVSVPDPRRFGLRWNGIDVFCRGAVFVPGLRDDAAADRRALEALRDAGGNMVRVGGTMRYEDPRFFDDCDELGLMVWQDFMLANMDYPIEDAAFAEELGAEVDEQLHRWARHPSLAVLCGGSEVAQQAAMMGQPAERWYGPLFEDFLPSRCRGVLPEVPYVMGSPSAPLEGDGADAPPPLPFRVDVGPAHYYGVGAYQRDFDDARRADVAFASECLALSNVPEPAAVEALFGDETFAVHAPRWKRGVPRDRSAGWDFEDVRDHYHARLFGLDAASDRYPDPEGYLERARVVSVEVLTRTFAEWRRAGSRTHGGLVWFLRDLVSGAGWGLIDHEGHAKAPLLALRRVWAPTALLLTDEGNNGLRLHVVQDAPDDRTLRLHVGLWRGGDTLIAETSRALSIAGRSARALDVDGLFGAFRDVGWAFRFGPRGHDVVLAQLWDGEALVGEAAHLALPLPAHRLDPQLSATATRVDEHTLRVRVTAAKLALFVAARVPGWNARDGYFHMAPGQSREIELTTASATSPRGEVVALGAAPARIVGL